MVTIVQTTLDRVEIKVGVEMKDGKIDIMNGGTVILKGKVWKI